MVHQRDLARMLEVARGVAAGLSREANKPLAGALSDEELTRQAPERGSAARLIRPLTLTGLRNAWWA
jgi:hypothetical protein